MLSRYRLLAAAASVVALAACADSAHAASRTSLPGSVPPWAKASAAKGTAAKSDVVGFRVYLGLHDEAKAEALAAGVSDPRSSNYRDYLTPGQFRQRFAPTSTDVNAVKSWLTSVGMTVDYTPTNNRYVAAEGTVADVDTAFATQLKTYSVKGRTLRAPASTLSIPASLGATVSGVLGLDQSDELIAPDRSVGTNAPPSIGFRNAQPCSTSWAEKSSGATWTTSDGRVVPPLPPFQSQQLPYAPCGYTPPQIRGAYGLDSGTAAQYDGSGQTVAIIDAYASPTIEQDANTYFSRHGLPTFQGGQFSQVVAPGTYKRAENKRQDPMGWYGEETLDVEAVHTTAPGAKVVYVGAPNNYQDLDAALNHVVDRHLAQIVTNSYGFSSEFLPTGYIKPYTDTFIQAAAEGIGLYFSSGDDGDESINYGIGNETVDWPATSPWVTAVGGTSLGVSATNGYAGETGWSTANAGAITDAAGNVTGWKAPVYQYGAGGGTSRRFAQPSYQAGVVPASIAQRWSSTPGRAVPDVGALADPNTGMLVGQTQTFSDGAYYDEYRIGGTSLASPLFAGVMAVADQAAGHAHGFANPALYRADAGAFHDVAGNPLAAGVVRADFANSENKAGGILYSVRTLNWQGANASIHVRPGYDDVTGRGTPNGSAFISTLSK